MCFLNAFVFFLSTFRNFDTKSVSVLSSTPRIWEASWRILSYFGSSLIAIISIISFACAELPINFVITSPILTMSDLSDVAGDIFDKWLSFSAASPFSSGSSIVFKLSMCFSNAFVFFLSTFCNFFRKLSSFFRSTPRVLEASFRIVSNFRSSLIAIIPITSFASAELSINFDIVSPNFSISVLSSCTGEFGIWSSLSVGMADLLFKTGSNSSCKVYMCFLNASAFFLSTFCNFSMKVSSVLRSTPRIWDASWRILSYFGSFFISIIASLSSGLAKLFMKFDTTSPILTISFLSNCISVELNEPPFFSVLRTTLLLATGSENSCNFLIYLLNFFAFISTLFTLCNFSMKLSSVLRSIPRILEAPSRILSYFGSFFISVIFITSFSPAEFKINLDITCPTFKIPLWSNFTGFSDVEARDGELNTPVSLSVVSEALESDIESRDDALDTTDSLSVLSKALESDIESRDGALGTPVLLSVLFKAL